MVYIILEIGITRGVQKSKNNVNEYLLIKHYFKL